MWCGVCVCGVCDVCMCDLCGVCVVSHAAVQVHFAVRSGNMIVSCMTHITQSPWDATDTFR